MQAGSGRNLLQHTGSSMIYTASAAVCQLTCGAVAANFAFAQQCMGPSCITATLRKNLIIGNTIINSL
jgi:hypothetical protein